MKANLIFDYHDYLRCLKERFYYGFTIRVRYKNVIIQNKLFAKETKWLEWDKKYMKITFMPVSHKTKVACSSVIKLPAEYAITQAVIQGCYLKQLFLKSRKILEKYLGRDFLLKL